MTLKISTRINKYISESGICSRRDADRFIEQGSVYIDGKKAQAGDQVFPGNEVKVNGQIIEPQEAEDLVFIALNKPVGIVSTTEEAEKDNIVNFVNHSKRIFPIGRLDKDSQGLILLTNNGDLVNKILRANNNHEKEYRVTVNRPITDEFITGMSSGVPILGGVTKKCKLAKESTYVFTIILIQGLNRQIRRMCEFFGFEVVKLERIRIMNVSIKGLAIGDWRDLTQQEVTTIISLTENSTSTAKKVPAAKPTKEATSNKNRPGKPDQSKKAQEKKWVKPKKKISDRSKIGSRKKPEKPTANKPK